MLDRVVFEIELIIKYIQRITIHYTSLFDILFFACALFVLNIDSVVFIKIFMGSMVYLIYYFQIYLIIKCKKYESLNYQV